MTDGKRDRELESNIGGERERRRQEESERMTERGRQEDGQRRSEVQREICHQVLSIKTHFSVTGEPKLSSPLQFVSHRHVINSF